MTLDVLTKNKQNKVSHCKGVADRTDKIVADWRC